MSLGQHGCQPEAKLNWDLADNDSNSTSLRKLLGLQKCLVVVRMEYPTPYKLQKQGRNGCVNLNGAYDNQYVLLPRRGGDALVVSDTGRVMKANPFTPDHDTMKVKLVDAALKYDCPL
eukprot:9392509-Ditylum_brightwellii.AAC.1